VDAERLVRLTDRAQMNRTEIPVYLERILRYQLLQGRSVAAGPTGEGAHGAGDLLLVADIPDRLREALALVTQRHEGDLSAVAARLVADFLERHPADPTDFGMLTRLSEIIESRGRVTWAELTEVLALFRSEAFTHMPEEFRAQWLFERIKPYITGVEEAGRTMELTPALVRALCRFIQF
jgi:hypothetical protein